MDENNDDENWVIEDSIERMLLPPFTCFLCAMPRGGKSYMERYLCRLLMKGGMFNRVRVFSPTCYDDWAGVPDEWKFDIYDERILESIIEEQRLLGPDNKTPDGRLLLVFDDLLGLANFQSRVWTHLVSTYRHLGISMFISTQQLVKLPTLIRNIASHTFIFKQPRQAYEALYSAFGADWDSKDDFIDMLRENTAGNHECVIYTRRGIRSGPDTINWLRFTAPPNADNLIISLENDIDQ